MPDNDQIDSIGPYAGSTTYVGSFSPVLGGVYNNGALTDKSTRGRWWGSTAYDGATRYFLGYNGSSLYTTGYISYAGLYVRCVQAS
ncbi:hypothetical protein IJG93_03565 [Candidatus Saccharibacteria bacterium]|nr:hypothetical protein [Candidatus Saccharibacteria bacterium]